jgi:hypothetical protein
MTSEQIRKKLDELSENKKARTFFNHLVRAYFPVNKVEKVFSKPRGPFRCVITNEPLISTAEIVAGIHSNQFKADFHEHMKTMFDSSTDAQHPMTKLIGDKKIGVTSKDTTTNMSFSTFQIFYDWVVTRMLMGDKHISWLLKEITKNDFMDRAETINDPELQKKIKGIRKTQPKQATFTLGDFSALQALKDKMSN